MNKSTVALKLIDYLPFLIFAPTILTSLAIPYATTSIPKNLQPKNYTIIDMGVNSSRPNAVSYHYHNNLYKECLEHGFAKSLNQIAIQSNSTETQSRPFLIYGLCSLFTVLTILCIVIIKVVSKHFAEYLSPQQRLLFETDISTYICSLLILNGFVLYITYYCICFVE